MTQVEKREATEPADAAKAKETSSGRSRRVVVSALALLLLLFLYPVSRDTDAAANDVRDRTARVRDVLPDEIDEPIVSKTEADAEAIIYLAFSSDRHSPLDVTDFADRVVKDRLATLPGVADVPIFNVGAPFWGLLIGYAVSRLLERKDFEAAGA